MSRLGTKSLRNGFRAYLALPVAALLVACGGNSDNDGGSKAETASESGGTDGTSGGTGGDESGLSGGRQTSGSGGTTDGGSGGTPTGGDGGTPTGGDGGTHTGGGGGTHTGGSGGELTGGSGGSMTGGSSPTGGSSGESTGGAGGSAGIEMGGAAGSTGTGAVSGASGAGGSSGGSGSGGGPTDCLFAGGICQIVATVAEPCAMCPTDMSTAFAPAPWEAGYMGCESGGPGGDPICCLPIWQTSGDCVDAGGQCYPETSSGDFCPIGWDLVWTACPEANHGCCVPGDACSES